MKRSEMKAASTSLIEDDPSPEDVPLSACHTEDGLLAPKVNQAQDLQSHHRPKDQATDRKSSSDWLLTHGLNISGLSLSTLPSHGTTKARAGDAGDYERQLEISAAALTHFDFKLYQAIELYHGRIRWLNQGSMKVFGLVKGTRVGVFVDTSNGNCTKERLADLQRDLLSLIEEQLCSKCQLYLMSFGTETSSLWDGPRNVHPLRLQEACGWVGELGASGGCNLLQALKKGLDLGCTELDSLVIILGSSPDQTPEALFDYLEQRMLGSALLIHVVSYCSTSPRNIETVKRLAEVAQGRYHIFSASLGVVESSTDVEQLWEEIKAARELLGHTEDLRQRRSGDMNDTVISTVLDSLSERPSLPRTPNQHALLTIKPSDLQNISSAEWLIHHGLKAKRLGLYQVLAPYAYSTLKGFVPILNKIVTSTVHEKAMVQFEWHDGTVKNVHVDIPLLYSYQEQLRAAVTELESRVLWLGRGSRQVWGTLCEQRVVMVVEMSELSSGSSLHIQQALRELLEEQLANKHSFNIIVFNSTARKWKERLVPPTPENLQDAWQWVQSLQCSGSRNTLDALRLVLEGDTFGASSPPFPPPSSSTFTQGLYLLTSGVPDQEMEVVTSYVSECCSSLPLHLHICLFTGEEPELQTGQEPEGQIGEEPELQTGEEPELQTGEEPEGQTGEEPEGQTGASLSRFATNEEAAVALRELAQAGGGRFHWTSETGILESDDITALIEEMEMAASYLQKSSMLVESLTQRSASRSPGEGLFPADKPQAQMPLVQRHREGPLPPPRPTALTLARLLMREGRAVERYSSLKANACGKSSATPATSTAQHQTCSRPVETNAKQKKPSQVSQSVFYLENGSLGVVVKSFSKPKSVRKSIPLVVLPKQEEICSTKQWLKRFSIKKQKLDLYKMMSGPDCTHHRTLVPSLLKRVSAKYCSIFPIVHINGAVKHLQLTPGELKQYLCQTEKLLHCYTRRMVWLLSGSRRMFGAVLEKKVCILLDVSGSMAPCLVELKASLASLIWDQLHCNTVRFSLLAFSNSVMVWRPALQEPTEEACHDAVQWVCQLDSHGGTSTLEALQVGCGFGDSMGLYLVSDGKPDSSCSLVLGETETLTAGKHITIHTVSFNCTDSSANDFLKRLAHKTGGRYHRYQDNMDAVSGRLASGLMDGDDPIAPAFDGNDLRRLAQEIDKLKHFRKQAHVFREMLLEKKHPEET
ncbi:hypothetical protein UPYG_G00104010 [Umbra pygmaea]|uniref:VWFA domain-containing protein n=1 Tax=Umbra pygmaea TaxID=75934 RepID=A0ABD0X1U8_UMBPY